MKHRKGRSLRLVCQRFLIALLGWLAITAAAAQGLQPIPALSGRVIDQTQTLTAAQIAELSDQLAQVEQRKGSQIAILMIRTTSPEPIEAYSIRVVDAWKLGRAEVQGKRVDDGVLILVAKDDRKLRIEVGQGLEGAIPDAFAKRIIAETMSPRFKQGDFAGGLGAGVSELGRLIDGESLPAPWQAGHAPPFEPADLDLLSILLLMLIGSFVLKAMFGRFVGSGVSGAITFGWVSTVTAAWGVALAAALGLFVVSLVLGAPGRGLARAKRHTWGGGPSISGGGWSGGSWGGSSGGGFSGGGGGFSGGGASGDW